MKTFQELPISDKILSALKEAGYEKPTPIQAQSIPPAIESRDIIGCAQTGTGKTAAFGIPILQRLSTETYSREPRALVLTPTRELAQQVMEFISKYGVHLKLRTEVIVGGTSMERQINALKSGTDIIVATPGRLLDLQRQGHIRLSKIEIVVLDEGDRMLDMGFIPDIRRIMRLIPKERQTLMFSATLPKEIERLARDFLRDPIRVEVSPPSTPVAKIKQVLHPVDFQKKETLLDHILRSTKVNQVLIFTRTKHAADFVTEFLTAKGHNVAAIHGDLSQSKRDRTLKNFRSGDVKILVATDLASRGLDIEGISHVINFDMPESAETYVHRIGRTARADADGVAISLVEFKDWEVIQTIEETTDRTIPREIVPGFEPKTISKLAATGGDHGKKKRGRRLLGKRR